MIRELSIKKSTRLLALHQTLGKTIYLQNLPSDYSPLGGVSTGVIKF